MALIECCSSQPGVASQWVEIECITDDEVAHLRVAMDQDIAKGGQVSDAVARAFLEATKRCPAANPSDLWQHVIYRHLLRSGWTDQRWKRVSGFALERALVLIYHDRLAAKRVRLHQYTKREAERLLAELGAQAVKTPKVDLFLEGKIGDRWRVFGAAHVKSSIAERIQDDVPASQALMALGLTSIAITMDAKSYPPPHGNCVNYGELGGRSMGVEKERIKRGYIEETGQFDALFSFNRRTPPSVGQTGSGKRIYTLGFFDHQPDDLTRFLGAAWASYDKAQSKLPLAD